MKNITLTIMVIIPNPVSIFQWNGLGSLSPAPLRRILTVSGWVRVQDTLVGPKYVMKNLGYLAVHSKALWSRALLPPLPKNCMRTIIHQFSQ